MTERFRYVIMIHDWEDLQNGDAKSVWNFFADLVYDSEEDAKEALGVIEQGLHRAYKKYSIGRVYG